MALPERVNAGSRRAFAAAARDPGHDTNPHPPRRTRRAGADLPGDRVFTRSPSEWGPRRACHLSPGTPRHQRAGPPARRPRTCSSLVRPLGQIGMIDALRSSWAWWNPKWHRCRNAMAARAASSARHPSGPTRVSGRGCDRQHGGHASAGRNSFTRATAARSSSSPRGCPVSSTADVSSREHSSGHACPRRPWHPCLST